MCLRQSPIAHRRTHDDDVPYARAYRVERCYMCTRCVACTGTPCTVCRSFVADNAYGPVPVAAPVASVAKADAAVFADKPQTQSPLVVNGKFVCVYDYMYVITVPLCPVVETPLNRLPFCEWKPVQDKRLCITGYTCDPILPDASTTKKPCPVCVHTFARSLLPYRHLTHGKTRWSTYSTATRDVKLVCPGGVASQM
jgi:hypothetical protein